VNCTSAPNKGGRYESDGAKSTAVALTLLLVHLSGAPITAPAQASQTAGEAPLPLRDYLRRPYSELFALAPSLHSLMPR